MGACFPAVFYSAVSWLKPLGPVKTYSPTGLNIDRLYAIKRPLQFHSTIHSTKWARRYIVRLRKGDFCFFRSVAICWVAALVPTVPLWFDIQLLEYAIPAATSAPPQSQKNPDGDIF